jgi:SHS2 domain-containing protein
VDATLSEGIPYRLIDHGADLGMEVRAPTLEALFVGAARALFDILGTLDATRVTRVETIEQEGEDLEEVFRGWLAELLFLSAARRMVFSEFRVLALDTTRLKAEAAGERFDRDRHTFEREIKAITYHGLEVVQEDREWRATVIFDV